MLFHAFLIKYAEIAIKGKNRYLFEDALVKQMRLALESVEGDFQVIKEQEECTCSARRIMILTRRWKRFREYSVSSASARL